ncbi:MAG: hypothetical protein LBM77_03775 [Spirochaetaceae bacterium]|nr:hypothetical protein [Spirochaetaceae bacterium]
MEKVRKSFGVAICIALVIGFAGCASTPASSTDAALSRVEQKTADTVVINWMNRDLGFKLTDMPDWLKTYVSPNGGISAVQAMPQFKDVYPIIAVQRGANLAFVTTWARSYEITNQLATYLRSGILNTMQAVQLGQQGTTDQASSSNDTSSGSLAEQISNRLSNSMAAMVTGLKREGEYWTEARLYDLNVKDKYTDTYTYYVMYTVEKAKLDQSITEAIKNNLGQDPALAELTSSMMSEIAANGIKFSEDAFIENADDTAAFQRANQAAAAALEEERVTTEPAE